MDRKYKTHASQGKSSINRLIPSVRVGSVSAVQRRPAAAHRDVAVHEAGIGHFWTLPAATCGTEIRHSSVIGGMLPHFRILIPSDPRHVGSKYQDFATKFWGNTCLFDV